MKKQPEQRGQMVNPFWLAHCKIAIIDSKLNLFTYITLNNKNLRNVILAFNVI